MKSLFTNTIITAFALVITSKLIPGIVITGVMTLLFAALVLGLLNGLVKPVVLLLTLPLTVLTFGLFVFIINACMFVIAASLVPGFAVSSFWTGLLGSLLVSIISTLTHRFLS